MNFFISGIKASKLLLLGILASFLYIVSTVSILAAEEEPAKEEVTEAEKAEPLPPVEPAGLRNDRAIAEQIGDSEAKWLKAGETEFLGIYNPDSSGNVLGSVLIIPAPGNSPLVSGVLPKLATELASKGWNTLAITLPELNFSGPAPTFAEEKATTTAESTDTDESATEETAATEKAAEDNEAAMPDPEKWYADQQTKNMEKLLLRLLAAEAEILKQNPKYVLLAQGASAELALELISSNVIKASALVTLNIEHPVYQRSTNIPVNLAKIKIPVLDIYNVTDKVAAAKRKTRQKEPGYRQLYIPGTDNNYLGSEKLLLKRVRGWLSKSFPK